MNKMRMYVIKTINDRGEHWEYYQEAESAQKAVNACRMYKGDEEEIEEVFKKCITWK